MGKCFSKHVSFLGDCAWGEAVRRAVKELALWVDNYLISLRPPIDSFTVSLISLIFKLYITILKWQSTVIRLENANIRKVYSIGYFLIR